jgi:hypothetical protein
MPFNGNLSQAIENVDEFVNHEIADRHDLADHEKIEKKEEWEQIKADLISVIQNKANDDYQHGYDCAARAAMKVAGLIS